MAEADRIDARLLVRKHPPRAFGRRTAQAGVTVGQPYPHSFDFDHASEAKHPL
jgi:hypothetical protein